MNTILPLISTDLGSISRKYENVRTSPSLLHLLFFTRENEKERRKRVSAQRSINDNSSLLQKEKLTLKAKALQIDKFHLKSKSE